MNVLTYEQLKQRLDAVVAECADMKNAHAAVLEHISVTDKGPAGTAAMIASDALYNTATPNVTAALAEVEAKGIEKFAAHLHDQAPHVEECDMESYEVFGHLATEFAKALREGRV
ncbi:hypothetical protein [Serratia fonticola]